MRTSDQAKAQLAVEVVGFALGEPLGDLGGYAPNKARTCRARRIAMYLTYTAFQMSLSRCARAFCRDRSTIAHACQIIEDQRDDDDFDDWIDGLEAGLKSLAPFAAAPQEAS